MFGYYERRFLIRKILLLPILTGLLTVFTDIAVWTVPSVCGEEKKMEITPADDEETSGSNTDTKKTDTIESVVSEIAGQSDEERYKTGIEINEEINLNLFKRERYLYV